MDFELLEQPRQLQPHLVAQLGVDVAQGIVEQQDLGPAHQRPAKRGALLLPVRELARQVVQHVGYAQELGHLLHALLDVGLVHPAGAERARDVLEGRQMRVEGEVLERHADLALLGPEIDHGLVADPHVAGIGREHARDQAQEHGLAGARGAEHGDGLAALDGERHVAQHLLLAERLGHLIEDEIAHGAQPLTAPRERPSTR